MAKGGSFEREMATQLSLLWSEGEREDLVRRTSGSGSRFTSRKKVNKDTAFEGGDLTLADPEIRPLFDLFSIEAKTGYCSKSKQKKEGEVTSFRIQNWCVLDVLDSTKTKRDDAFIEMWKQARRDADAQLKSPMLLFRRLTRKSCIVLEDFLVRSLFSFKQGGYPYSSIQLYLKEETITIFNYMEFADWMWGSFKKFVLKFNKENYTP
jgi:hypothetical protein